MKTIIWNNLAVQDYHENIEYLLNRWSDKEAITFINDVESLIFDLRQGIVEHKESGYRDIKQCVVVSRSHCIISIINRMKLNYFVFGITIRMTN